MASTTEWTEEIDTKGVFIAGSGPIGCTFARYILENTDDVDIWMAEIGAQDNPTVGAHHKNAVKYQKDIDAFVHVIQGALQPTSVPPSSSHMPTLGNAAWAPKPGQKLQSSFFNPNQVPELNLPGCATTRTVGGMATHWTCACPEPAPEERKDSPILDKLPQLYPVARKYLGVKTDQFECSARHNLVKAALEAVYGKERVTSLPLAATRSTKNPELVTWSGANTVLGPYVDNTKRFHLKPEHKVIRLVFSGIAQEAYTIKGVLVHDLRNHKKILVKAKKYVIACGAVCTPQILWNSKIDSPNLGCYLTEQSIAFCQVVLKRELIDKIEETLANRPDLLEKIRKHREQFPNDPLPIPFTDPEPQVTMPYSSEAKKPWHTQIHRDAFSYGDVGPRADPRVIVDLRFFGQQKAEKKNRVKFEEKLTDIYGMPQATFEVERSPEDSARDHEMMRDMCEVANVLGPFLPESYPQFMKPGLALHITGTTRIGNDPSTSVANQYSQVYKYPDLYVGGNNVIPDSTACNPTLTSVVYAIHAAKHLVEELHKPAPDTTKDPKPTPETAKGSKTQDATPEPRLDFGV